MKKILLCLLVFFLAGCSSSSSTTVQDPDQKVYNQLQEYYTKLDSIESLDDLIAMESLGIETDELELNDALFSTKTIGSTSKTIIALALHEDSRIYDYLPLLEASILDNGAVQENAAANFQVYGVLALYITHSNQLEKATDYLVSTQNANGSFSASYGEDLDITSWCVEALCLVDKEKYQDSIDQGISYMNSCKKEDYYDGGYGNNADTTSSVLEGMLADEIDISEELESIYTFQNDDGTFYSPTTGEGINNAYTTSEVARLLGDYYNGNVYEKAREEYEKIN